VNRPGAVGISRLAEFPGFLLRPRNGRNRLVGSAGVAVIAIRRNPQINRQR
jgi:hypothetical protein